MERPYASVLQKFGIIKGASVIKKRIQNRINAWNEDKISALSSCVVKNAEAMMGRKQENVDAKESAEVFNSCSVEGKLAQHYAT